MAQLTSRNQPGKREDLRDIIAVVDARQCVVTSLIPKGSEPTNPLGTWQADDYPDVNIRGSVDEQDVTEFENLVGRVPISGRIQITERKPKVSRVAQNVSDVAGVGRRKEMAKSVAKGITMAKRDMEARTLCNLDSREDDGVVGGETRGLFKWVDNNAQGDLPVPEKARTPSSSIITTPWADLRETHIRDNMLGSIWDETGMNGNFVMVVGRQLKALITNWSVYQPNLAGSSTVRTFQAQQTDKVLMAAIDRMEGDFGSLELITSPWLRRELDPSAASSNPSEAATNKDVQQRSGLCLDTDMLELRFNEMPNYRAFEDQGGGPRGLIEAIWMLCHLNPRGSGKVIPGGL